ncbi:prolyl oligopeptidase family serine peptidase [Oscillatoria amoena NRMC-F 0135]|nr:prolyl oligopeptidase family serine peptidase [Oscillatoria amoena NRMC-F 0135]
MRKATYFLLLLSTLFACKTTETEAPPAQYSIEQFMDVKNIFSAGFSQDETKLLLGSNETGIYNAFELDLVTGEKKQLTKSTEESVFPSSYFPGDDRVVYTSDKGGDEIDHIFVRSSDGSVVDIITDSKAKANFYGWSYDKKMMYYTSNSRDQRFFDLYSVNVEAAPKEGNIYPSMMVYQNEQGLDPTAISRDNRYIALIKPITTNNSDVYVLDTQTKQTRHITPHEGDVDYSPQYFSPDGKKLIYLTNEGSEFMYIASYDLATAEKVKMEEAPWDIMYTYLSRNGKYRVVAINNDARTEMKVYNEADRGKLVQLKNVPTGDVTGVNISDSEKLMTFYVSTSKSPSNLYLYNLETNEIKQLTNTLTAEINPDDLVEATVVRFKSYDGLEIPALLYKPKGLKEGDKVPALVQVHGGPGGQTRLNYSSSYQYFVNHGYAILCVNNRGSSGYGKTFYAADDKKHGDVDLKDCIAGKQYLQTLDFVDAEKIGIYGGSYGGYMVMAALAFAPEEFDVGVNLFGVTNWLRTLKSIPPWWTSFRDALYTEMGDPVKDSVALYNKSPLFHANKITKPFIVLQGSNDPRVLQVESDEIVEAAKANNVQVEYVIFPDEGHGWVKKENQIKSAESILLFLDKYLKGQGN